MSHDISKSIEAGGWAFPGRADYLSHYGIVPSEGSGRLEIDPATAIEIQRDWHSRGQNGCVFAMRAARQLDLEQWSASVHDELPDPHTMHGIIQRAVDDPKNEIHSFILPNVTTPEQIRELMDVSVAAGCVMREHAEIDGVEIFRLRWLLGDGSVESWMVGFASMTEVPPTRRAPFTELVIRTKLRGEEVHRELNHDPDAAHVANINLGFGETITARLIVASKQRAAKLLGGPAARAATPGARAKTTYGLALPQTEDPQI